MDKAKHKPESNGTAPKPKEKRRSNEKRKEKSRDAARCRRSRETEIFTELGQVLPLQQEDVEQLDKASIMRLSIAYLKVRDMLNLLPNIGQQGPSPLLSSENDKTEEIEKKPFDLLNGSESYKYLSAALDGFLLILSGEGDITYASESISDYLGISQIDLLGQQIWEYTHQCDHDELKEALNIRRCSLGDDKPKENSTNGNSAGNENNVITTAHRDLFLRLKCTLTSRGRSVNIKSASYKVIHVTGHMVMNTSGDRILIGVGRPLPHPSNIEIPLGSSTFLTKHSLEMKFTYVDDKMLSLLGYQPDDLLDKSLYNYHHGADSESLMTTFRSVLSKGQGETCRYRFLGKCGGYCWVVTQATIVYDKQKPQSVVCVNYAISELENNNEIYSCAQLEAHRENKEVPDKDQHHQENIVPQPKNNNNTSHHQTQSKYCSSEKLQNVAIPKTNPCAADARVNTTISPLNGVGDSQQEIVFQCIESSNINCPTNASSLQQIRNSNSNITFNNRKRLDDIALSPIRRTLKNCSTLAGVAAPPIAIPTTTDKRPKSVTASVFTQVPVSTEHISALIQAQSVSGNYQQPPNLQNHQQPAAPAKSVTASVFTPISALSTPINRKFLPNSFGKPLAARNNSTDTSNNSNNSNNNNTTEDMNSRYLMFSDESTALTMLKEEPDDLTHLAPSFHDSAQLFGEMLDSLILPDAYGTLIPDDINSLDSQHSNCNKNKNNNNSHLIDPFINYRDESSDTSSSPHLLSPGSISKSPEMSSIPSLCSPNSLSQDDEFAFMTMNNVEDDIDLTMRAPYIPMNEQDDLPLLTEDLMWSAFPEEFSLHKEALQMEALKSSSNSALSNTSNSINISSSNSLSATSSSATTTTVNSSSKCSSSVGSNHNISSNKNTINTTQDNNNSLNDNESSLATLLCGNGGGAGVNSLHQHQSQHHHEHIDVDDNNTSGVSVNTNPENECKRRKIELESNDESASDLMDSIDDFGPVFSKNSPRVGCWTINDLLQINNNSSPSSPTASPHHQQPEKQNIIICTAMPTTTIHVPLTSIQNKTQNSKINCMNILENSTTLKSNVVNSGSLPGSKNTNTSSNQMRRLSATVVKGMSINIAPQTISSNSKLNLNSTKTTTTNLNIGSIINTQNSVNSSKRPSNVILNSPETKRVKNASMIETPASPHLLQQLMAPNPQRIGSSKTAFNKAQGQWLGGNGDVGIGNGPSGSGRNNAAHQSSRVPGVETQPSNSVLKNLLVSGCDEPSSVNHANNIRDGANVLRPLGDILATGPLICKISPDVHHRIRTNPLIGGVDLLPSPPIPITAGTDDGSGTRPSSRDIFMDPVIVDTFSPVGSDSGGSDSGVECGSTSNRISSLMQSVYRNINRNKETKKDFSGSTRTTTTIPVPSSSNITMTLNSRDVNVAESGVCATGSRKLTFSLLDEDNPLCSPFLMDLCNDDYSMDDQMSNEFLQGNEITKVFDGWSPPDTTT